MRTLLFAGLALIASACATAPAATPTSAPPAPTAVPTAIALAPQPQAQPQTAPKADPTPTPAPVKAEPKIAAPQPRGQAIVRDDTLRNDAVFVSIDDLPAGQEFFAWLANEDGTLALGTLAPAAASKHAIAFVDADQRNLLGDYERVLVGRTADEPLLTGSLPEKALVHLRHVLVGISATPNGIGFGIGLRQETEELLRHAQFLAEALDEGNLPLEKLHAEHMINLIEGSDGEHFGDLNGNGKVDNPGDGFGVLPSGTQDGYVKGMRDHARLAAETTDATDEIKLHAGHVQIAGDNTVRRTSELRDRALTILNKRSVADTRPDVQKILSLAHQTIQGVDLNGDEQIAPVPGEGGAAVAYQHAQLMAVVPLARPSSARRTEPTPTAAPVHQHAAPKTLTISIGDNTFAPTSISVPKGSIVTWTQDGQRPHTVTADDEAFNSGLMRTGGTFQHTFDAAGTYLYFCELHGGPGGAGMAAEITVES